MDASSAPRPHLFRLQFSLRLLLIALSLFAIGFPIWYRWPFEEKVVTVPGVYHITTWQRQWGGEKLKHGRETRVQGKLKQVFTYRRGQLHGPYTLSTVGRSVERGQYIDGKKEGLWTASSENTEITSHYHHGLLDGSFESQTPSGYITATFAAGRLLSFNGKRFDDRLFEVLKSGVIAERIANELNLDTAVDLVEVPLIDAIQHLREKHNLPQIIIDTNTIAEPDLPITGVYSGLTLAAVLTLITEPIGLACDYRYGCVWITTADDARDWHDPTGVADIGPPKDSALSRAWNEPVAFREVAVDRGSASAFRPPIAGAAPQSAHVIFAALADRLNISIDAPVMTPETWVSRFVFVPNATQGLPFHDMLGQLLYFTGCRCTLEGDRLVILPPE